MELADDAAAATVLHYDSLPSRRDFTPTPRVDDTLADRLEASARYALLTEEVKDPPSQLERTGVRAIHDTSRNTLIENVQEEGGRWARIPSFDACGFCRMLGTRGPVYRSAHAAAASHDKCKCEVRVQRPGMTLTRPEYMSGWNDDYKRHRALVIAEGKTVTGKEGRNNIVNSWNRELFAQGIRERTPSVDIDARNVA